MLCDAESKTVFPKVSVITAVYNGEKYIEECILSVRSQTYKEIEHIIIDGGSTDGTLAIINRYCDDLSYWTTEPDNGIADAMNKGIEAATGEYIIIIHTDDKFYDENSLAIAMNNLGSNVDMAMFSILYGDKGELRRPKTFEMIINLKPQGYHQGMICKKLLFNTIGNFDLTYEVAMDYEFCLRANRNKAQVMTSSLILSCMGDKGISARTDWNSLQERFSEERRIHFQHCNTLAMKMFYLIYWPLYIAYRKVKYILSINML